MVRLTRGVSEEQFVLMLKAVIIIRSISMKSMRLISLMK